MPEIDPSELAADIFAKDQAKAPGGASSGADPVPPAGAEASDSSDAEDAAIAGMMGALEKKDLPAFKSAFKAAVEICYPELAASKGESTGY